MIATLRVVWVILATGCTLATIPMVKAAEPRAAVFASAASDWGDAVRQAMIERLRKRGCAVQSWGDAELSDAARLNPAALDLLVVCDARHAPAPALAPLANYARAGKLLVLGGPYFEHVSWPYAGKFLGRDELLTRAAADGRSKLLFDFESPELSGWLHSSSEPKSASRAAPRCGRSRRIPGLDAPGTGRSPQLGDFRRERPRETIPRRPRLDHVLGQGRCGRGAGPVGGRMAGARLFPLDRGRKTHRPVAALRAATRGVPLLARPPSPRPRRERRPVQARPGAYAERGHGPFPRRCRLA